MASYAGRTPWSISLNYSTCSAQHRIRSNAPLPLWSAWVVAQINQFDWEIICVVTAHYKSRRNGLLIQSYPSSIPTFTLSKRKTGQTQICMRTHIPKCPDIVKVAPSLFLCMFCYGYIHQLSIHTFAKNSIAARNYIKTVHTVCKWSKNAYG